MNQIIINATGKQNRIALVENGELAQLFIESEDNQRTVGNIYVAAVRKVMPGIKAAFIDMNTPKDAFLHFSDAGDNLEQYVLMLNGKNAIPDTVRLKPGETLKDAQAKQQYVGKILQSGHKLLVQIVKEPIGNKGPRISTDITIAGRYLVLIPMGDYIAISKKIGYYKERRRLKSIVEKVIPEGFGVIVRTVAKDQSREEIEEDLRDVLQKWEQITSRLKGATPPTLLYRDLDMTESLIRDLFAKQYDRVLIDDPKMYKSIKSYIMKVAPEAVKSVELYKGSEHVFNHMKIASDVNSIFSNRVRMPSGGYLIFEQTEAMYVVDVNSGPYAANEAQEENSLKTNLEAAREIAKQLRLRDIGGIIVIDFIDLKQDSNRKKVYDEIRKEFSKDPAKTNVLPMSDFGLVQITRQRIRPSVVNSVSVASPFSNDAKVKVLSKDTLIANLETWISTFKHNTDYRAIDVYLNPYLRAYLNQGIISTQFKWSWKYRLKINFIESEEMNLSDFKVTLNGSDVDITQAVMNGENIEKLIQVADNEGAVKRDDDVEVYEKDSKKKSNRNNINTSNRDSSRSRSDNNDTRSNNRRPSNRGSGNRSTQDSNDENSRQGNNRSNDRRNNSRSRNDNRSNNNNRSNNRNSGGSRSRRPNDNQGDSRQNSKYYN